jgi:hypothetical protein
MKGVIDMDQTLFNLQNAEELLQTLKTVFYRTCPAILRLSWEAVKRGFEAILPNSGRSI